SATLVKAADGFAPPRAAAGTPTRAATPAAAGNPAVATNPAAAGQLTEESLGRLLQAMGLEVKKEEKRYDFSFDAVHEGEEWRLTMSAVLSQNGKSIWIMAWLDELPRSAADVPRTALLRLLADNDRLGNGKFFAYIASNRRFVLQRVIPNENLSTAEFRDALQDLGGSVADTYAHWAVENWKAGSATANATPPAPSSDVQDADKTAPTTPAGPAIRARTLPGQSALEDSKFRGAIRN
ncbi:MAG: type III secretion system chaperone, partial [Planctomycetaceae bacterium]